MFSNGKISFYPPICNMVPRHSPVSLRLGTEVVISFHKGRAGKGNKS